MRTAIVFLCFYLSLVYCGEHCKDDDVTNADKNIFGTIPTLFAYVLNMLQERPEILEQNDVRLYTEDFGNENESNYLVEDEVKNIDRNVEFDTHMTSVYRLVGPVKMVSGLTAEEVAEQVLRVEQRLEEYNKVNNK